jgi:ribosomal protein L10
LFNKNQKERKENLEKELHRKYTIGVVEYLGLDVDELETLKKDYKELEILEKYSYNY